ncbi:hypothetical protein SVIOM74S_09011 [Streptomyces violarus]
MVQRLPHRCRLRRPDGISLKAVGAGTVVSAGWGGAYGNPVVLKLNDGSYAQYAHLSSLSVSAGQTVSGGQQVGLSGATGNVTGPHLHFEIRTTPDYGSDVDPGAACLPLARRLRRLTDRTTTRLTRNRRPDPNPRVRPSACAGLP